MQCRCDSRVKIFIAVVCAAALPGCSDSSAPPDTVATEIELVSPAPQHGLAGRPLPDSVAVRVLDQAGAPMPNVTVRFNVTAGGGTMSPGVRQTDSRGVARAEWVLGAASEEQNATARVILSEGPGPEPADDQPLVVALQGVAIEVSETMSPMLEILGAHIRQSIDHLHALFPLNPHVASEIEARIALLKTPGLGSDILRDRRFGETAVSAMSDRTIPIIWVFPAESMRTEAAVSEVFIAAALPVLESFLTVFPANTVRLWHGFTLGNRGGGGTLMMEDRATYSNRGGALPYDAILVHELAHSYIGNESMTQFLEMYGYNVVMTGSESVSAWSATRNYDAGNEGNAGVHALLDVYQLVGPAIMSDGYRAVLPLRPPYGQPLSLEAQEAFGAVVPEHLRSAVAARLSMVGI